MDSSSEHVEPSKTPKRGSRFNKWFWDIVPRLILYLVVFQSISWYGQYILGLGI